MAQAKTLAIVCREIQEKKLLLKPAQSPSLNSEGANVEQDVEVWIDAVGDCFSTPTKSVNACMVLPNGRDKTPVEETVQASSSYIRFQVLG